MNDDDDDDANFLIQEEKPSTSKSLVKINSFSSSNDRNACVQKLDDFDGRDGGAAEQDEAEDGQHGGLVKKMLDAKKMAKDGSEIAGQRSETVKLRPRQKKIDEVSSTFRKPLHRTTLNVVANEKRFRRTSTNFEKRSNR